MGVEMCNRRRKRRNVFGKKVICILDPPIQVWYFIVSLICEILLVRMIDKSCSENKFTLLITDNSHNTFYGWIVELAIYSRIKVNVKVVKGGTVEQFYYADMPENSCETLTNCVVYPLNNTKALKLKVFFWQCFIALIFPAFVRKFAFIVKRERVVVGRL